tara:strand:+ start:1104 stop:1241 length:138 start_codon:yes stop_codon:yes gene_type:complete
MSSNSFLVFFVIPVRNWINQFFIIISKNPRPKIRDICKDTSLEDI